MTGRRAVGETRPEQSVADAFRFPCRVHESPWPWIGAPGDNLGPYGQELVVHRARALVWGGTSALPDGGHGFDEVALISLGDRFYLAHAAACGCSDPEEVWLVEWIGRLPELLGVISSGRDPRHPIPEYAVGVICAALELVDRLVDR